MLLDAASRVAAEPLQIAEEGEEVVMILACKRPASGWKPPTAFPCTNCCCPSCCKLVELDVAVASINLGCWLTADGVDSWALLVLPRGWWAGRSPSREWMLQVELLEDRKPGSEDTEALSLLEPSDTWIKKELLNKFIYFHEHLGF